MSLHKEITFETEICQHLGAHGWLYSEGAAAGYDRARALFPADVLAWVRAAQPDAWDALAKNHGSQAGDTLLGRLRDQLDRRGTLDVLRHGIELLGLKHPLKLAEFKPALAINPNILARYAANRLRIIRQVRYSLHNENCLDLVLFLNGVPVATVELKTDFTQSVDDAVDQYRFDRLPRPKGQNAEPLLSFPHGALVHFAVSNSDVRMTTKLEGANTAFLPFNQGDHGAAGNPVNPSGHRTAYLWEQVSAPTDPNLVYNLRAKLDASGHYDDAEVERVVAAELDPAGTQGALAAAIDPVAKRLLDGFKTAQGTLKAARDRNDDKAAEASQNEMNALVLFKGDIGAFVRLYTFLSQIFDYGNTGVEKRAIFFRRLIPLLELGREREGIDLSKIVLTHHHLKDLGRHAMPLNEGAALTLEPITEAGSGSVQEKEKAFLHELIDKVNDLFEGDLTDQDKLVYVNNVIKGKLLESATLQQQAANNSKEQFADSPDLESELLNAIMGALDAHTAMSTQALNSVAVQEGLKDILLNHARLWETLRDQVST